MKKKQTMEIRKEKEKFKWMIWLVGLYFIVHQSL